MGLRILFDRDANNAALYCSSTDVAFGPVFGPSDDGEHDAQEQAESFLRYLDTIPAEQWASYHPTRIGRADRDARRLEDADLQRAYSDWVDQQADQWKAEEAAKYGDVD